MMQNILKEWKKFLEEDNDAVNLPEPPQTGTGTRNVIDYGYGKSTKTNIQIQPVVPMTKEDQINLVNYYINSQPTIVRLVQFKKPKFEELLKKAMKSIVYPVNRLLPLAKKESLRQHLTPQSMKAYENIINQHSDFIPQDKESQEELYNKNNPPGSYYNIIKKQKAKLLSMIPSQINKILNESKILISFIPAEHAAISNPSASILMLYADEVTSTFLKGDEDVIADMVHEYGHIIDAMMGAFLREGITTPLHAQDKYAMSEFLVNTKEFIKKFYKSKYFVRYANTIEPVTRETEEYTLSTYEIYTRVKRLQLIINPRTGFVDKESLKKFIQNPNFPSEYYDVEKFFNMLDLSTDQKIQEFANFMNTIAKADVPQRSMVA